MKPSIQNILTVYRSIMLPWAEGKQYKNWDANFVAKNQADSEKRASGVKVNVTYLTDPEAELLGFPLWSEETGIRLVPLWLYEFLEQGQKLISISGDEVTVGPEYREQGTPGYIDNDHRGGALAYGFIPRASEVSNPA